MDSRYAVDVLTGKATGEAAFPSKYQVTDLALPINQKQPHPETRPRATGADGNPGRRAGPAGRSTKKGPAVPVAPRPSGKDAGPPAGAGACS